MIGDRIVAKPHHIAAAKEIFKALRENAAVRRTAISIAGESGSGKSEIADELAKLFNAAGINSIILQQDDYFFYPPKTNHSMRVKNIHHVGISEVNLKLLDEHIRSFKLQSMTKIVKPLVIFEEDRISEETIDPAASSLVIAEGTYTTLLKNVDHRVFISRNYKETREDRLERKRDVIDDFSERVLEIEHEIISKHRSLASLIVEKDYSVTVLSA